MEQVLERPVWRDYLELTKPTVVALMLLTAVIGMFMSVPGMVPWKALIFGNLGIALCAGAAAAINHLVDQRIDIGMSRTRNRPLVRGRVGTLQASCFATVLGAGGMYLLFTQVNALTAWLTLASLLGYAVVYTRRPRTL
jgi:protoheme IX farnesyltransferase